MAASRASAVLVLAILFGCERHHSQPPANVSVDQLSTEFEPQGKQSQPNAQRELLPLPMNPIDSTWSRMFERDGMTIYQRMDWFGGRDLLFVPKVDHITTLKSRDDPVTNSAERGNWIVCCYSIWSAPDIRCVGQVVDASKLLGDKVSFGIRPFEDTTESIKAVYQKLDMYDEFPHWMFFSDGKLRDIRHGVMNSKQIMAAAEKVFGLETAK
jgi:hypothetical protein